MKCVRCGKDAVAILNKKMPLCQQCVIDAQVYSLNIGAMVGISVQGEPQFLIVPSKEKLTDGKGELTNSENE